MKEAPAPLSNNAEKVMTPPIGRVNSNLDLSCVDTSVVNHQSSPSQHKASSHIVNQLEAMHRR